LRAPDGSVIRLGYGAVNGWDYTGIGSVMARQGLIGTGPGQYPGSMQGILRYIHDNPAQGDALMRQNRSYVFFRENPQPSAVGAMGVRSWRRPAWPPIRRSCRWAHRSGSRPTAPSRRAVGGTGHRRRDQGPNRFDSFWGAGADARRIAGG
jgi:membrane-bound lytic murein transglycosylase A